MFDLMSNVDLPEMAAPAMPEVRLLPETAASMLSRPRVAGNVASFRPEASLSEYQSVPMFRRYIKKRYRRMPSSAEAADEMLIPSSRK